LAFDFENGEWNYAGRISSFSFVCWNCNNKVASSKGYYKDFGRGQSIECIYICPHCEAPYLRDLSGKVTLSSLPGKEIKNLPEHIENVYFEIRKSMQVGCFTAAIMLMRKIIMNVAVHEGAKENDKFVNYITYLCDQKIVPPKSKSKADAIRTLGNDATHELESRTEEEAKKCFEFLELLLQVNYEFADEVK
jgi:hypothetical protein